MSSFSFSGVEYLQGLVKRDHSDGSVSFDAFCPAVRGEVEGDGKNSNSVDTSMRDSEERNNSPNARKQQRRKDGGHQKRQTQEFLIFTNYLKT